MVEYFVVAPMDDDFPPMDEWVWVSEGDNKEERLQVAKDYAISHVLSGRGPQEIFFVTCERVAHATVAVHEGSDPVV